MTLINKTELLDNIKRTIDTLQAHGDANYIRGMRDAMKIVEAMEPERKKGKWIYYPEINALSCSACKRYAYHYEPYNFCPNCGAEMKGEEE